MLKSTISSKGQITVPSEIRERMGLEAGTVVVFELSRDGVLLRKGGSGAHPVDQVFGVLGGSGARDSLAQLERMRGPRPGGRRGRRR